MSIAARTKLVVVRNGLGPLHIALPLADGTFNTPHGSILPASCTVWAAGRPARAVWGRWRHCAKCGAWSAGRNAIRTAK